MRCGCGYTFGQDLEDTLVLLDRQLRKGIGMAVTGGLLLIVGVALIIAMILAPHQNSFVYLSFGGWLGGFGLLARGTGTIVRTRTSQRDLEKRRKLPTARVVER
jgi:hypothetical protein